MPSTISYPVARRSVKARKRLLVAFCALYFAFVIDSAQGANSPADAAPTYIGQATLAVAGVSYSSDAPQQVVQDDAVTRSDSWTIAKRQPTWFDNFFKADRPLYVQIMLWMLYGIVALISVYAFRHYRFTYNRLFGRQRHPYVPIESADWPFISVVVPCHNEEAVVDTILDALLSVDYPPERMEIMPINDRSTDRTEEILNAYAARYPHRIRPLHRRAGMPGKAAALKDALEFIKSDVLLVFDADYIPGKDLLKRLAAPFLDPEIGAVMGRVVPVNTDRNLLTRMLDMERAGGYQVDQQARMNLDLVPQYGGTVGGIRVSALNAVGGWRESSLAEDTDITFRLVLGGWKVAYSNRYECYEEVPESWPVRIRQIMRWARGHTDAAMRYLPELAVRKRIPTRIRVDGALLLGTYLMSPLLMFGWVLAIALFFLGANPFLGALALLAVASYNTIGNFAAFFEIGAAARLDGTLPRIRLLPMILSGFLVSMVSTSMAVMKQLLGANGALEWHKTERFRSESSVMPSTVELSPEVVTATSASGGDTRIAVPDAAAWMPPAGQSHSVAEPAARGEVPVPAGQSSFAPVNSHADDYEPMQTPAEPFIAGSEQELAPSADPAIHPPEEAVQESVAAPAPAGAVKQELDHATVEEREFIAEEQEVQPLVDADQMVLGFGSQLYEEDSDESDKSAYPQFETLAALTEEPKRAIRRVSRRRRQHRRDDRIASPDKRSHRRVVYEDPLQALKRARS